MTNDELFSRAKSHYDKMKHEKMDCDDAESATKVKSIFNQLEVIRDEERYWIQANRASKWTRNVRGANKGGSNSDVKKVGRIFLFGSRLFHIFKLKISFSNAFSIEMS